MPTRETSTNSTDLRTLSNVDSSNVSNDTVSQSGTYIYVTHMNSTEQLLVSRNSMDDHYDTSLRGDNERHIMPMSGTLTNEDNSSGQSMVPYMMVSHLQNQPPPTDVRPGWCSKKRVLIIGIIVLIRVLVSSLTVTTTLLITGTSGQTGGNPPPSSTKATSTPVSTAPPTTPTTSTSTTVPSSISAATTPRLNSTPTTVDTSSPHAISTFTSTPATSTSPSASTTLASSSTYTISVSLSTTTTVLASSITLTTTANTRTTNTSSMTPSPSTPSTSTPAAASTTTSPTTTSCSSSRKCHSCNSRNSRCPVNGTMAGTDPGQVMPCPCGTACFSAVRYSDGNVVHRGCTKEYPLWDSASSTDLSCREIADDHFLCFCLGDRCNTHDMTPYIPL